MTFRSAVFAVLVAALPVAGTGAAQAIRGTAAYQASTGGAPAGLEGTAWQLVKFQGGDGRLLVPDDSSKYTIEFAAGGSLAARVDCNRGRGSWKATPPSGLEMGPLALTRARCPEGSLHDQIVQQWAFIRSFVIKDRRLFISLMADGGVYEFEPAPSRK